MAKTLIYTIPNENATNAANWGSAKAAVQSIVDQYNALPGLGNLASGELDRLFNDLENFVFDKMTGGNGGLLTFGTGGGAVSLPVVRKQAMELLVKPVGYDALKASIDNFYKKCYDGWGMRGASFASFAMKNIADHFVIDEDGDLQYSTARATYIAEYGKQYVRTQLVKNLYAFAQDLVAAYFENNLHEAFDYLPQISGLTIPDKPNLLAIVEMAIADIIIEGETFIPNYQQLMSKDRNLIDMGFTES